MLSGVFIKEQEVKGLIRLGLGFMLKEIRQMRLAGRDPFGKKSEETIEAVNHYQQITSIKNNQVPENMIKALGSQLAKKVTVAKLEIEAEAVKSYQSNKD